MRPSTRSQLRKHSFSISGSPKPRSRSARTRICKPGRVADFRRDHSAVEIGAKSHAVLAQMFEQVLDMPDDQFRCGVSLS